MGETWLDPLDLELHFRPDSAESKSILSPPPFLSNSENKAIDPPRRRETEISEREREIEIIISVS